MVWSDVFSWVTKTRVKWNNRGGAGEERKNPEGKKQGRLWCWNRDRLSAKAIEEGFAVSQWPQVPHWLFIVFRCLAALYFTTWLVTSWILFKDTHKGGFSKWFIFLTNWSFALLVLQACSLTWSSLRWRTKRQMHQVVVMEDDVTADELKDDVDYVEEANVQNSNNVKKLGVYYHVMWIFDNIASTMAIGVTISFWAFLYNSQQPPSVVTVHTHGINAVYVILDQVLCRRPRRLIDFYQPIIFGIIYVIFSYIYWGLGGTDPNGRHYVYPFLDWEKPGKSILFAFVFAVLATAIIYLFLYAIYRLRTFVHIRLIRPVVKYEDHSRRNSAIAI